MLILYLATESLVSHGRPIVLECEAHLQLSLALEGLTECLVDELDPAWNIKVT